MSFELDRIVDRMIAEAIEAGKFDDLVGKGQPLNLEDDPLTPPHLRMGNRILKNANVLPDWVQLDLDIRGSRTDCEQLWEHIAQELPVQELRARNEDTELARRRYADWYRRMRTDYLRALKCHNDGILKYNLAAPNSPTIYIPYPIKEETERFDSVFPAPPEVSESVPTSVTKQRGMLRDSAVALYEAGLIKGSE